MTHPQGRWRVIMEASLHSHLHSADFLMQEAQRFADLQFTTAKRSIEESATHLKALTSAKDAQELTALSMEIAHVVRDQTLSYAKSVYESAVHAQSQFAQRFGAQLKDFSDAWVADVEDASQIAPIGGPVALALLRSTVDATHAAVDTLSRAVSQAATASDDTVEVEERGAPVPDGHGKGRKAA